MNDWLARDLTGRTLNETESFLVTHLRDLLEELHPPQLLPADTVLAAEGTAALICLLPHRYLGGLSLVVWLTETHVAVLWAQVGSLACCHDDLDLGLEIARFELKPAGTAVSATLSSVREQLSRPILLRTDRTRRWAELLLGVDGRPARTVGWVGERPRLLARLLQPTPVEKFTVAFTDSEKPPIQEPSGSTGWFREARA